MNNIKYWLGVILSLPLLPFMYFHGKRIRKTIPKLPEAKKPQGISGKGSNPLNLLAIGESTIAGVGVEAHKNGFTGALANCLSIRLQRPVRWKVYAQSGFTAMHVVHKIIPNLRENNIHLVVVGLGGNNAFAGHSPKRWYREIKSLCIAIRKQCPEAKVVFSNMPPIKDFPAFTLPIKWTIGNLVNLYQRELIKIERELDWVYFDATRIKLRDWMQRLDKAPGDFFSDGIHPSELTYWTWGTLMGEFIVGKVFLINNK